MPRFRVRYGIKEFGGCRGMPWEPLDASSFEWAEEIAYSRAISLYLKTKGNEGWRTAEQIMEEEGCDWDTARINAPHDIRDKLEFEVERVSAA